jgi:peptidyl-prolyl cis-trans isomerase D
VTEVAAADLGGNDLEGKPVALPLPADAMLKLVFATDSGQTSRVTDSPEGGIFAVRVSKITPSGVNPLAEVKDQAIAAWQADKRQAAVAKTAEELAAAIQSGTQLSAVAAEKGLKVATSPALLRRPGGAASTPPALVAKLFAAKPGEVVTAADATGSYVAQLDKVEVPEAPPQNAVADLSRELTTAIRGDLATEFTQALRKRFPVEIHRDVLERLF